ncbi:histidine phosphatase family protein [Streptomyces sp. NBC_00234]|uniref:histidine phosphatase family protein n=1 Tax=Streptomyces sp. NBC_00234 TaxID=2903638 RepID=UPI002E2A7A97|nr:histidine phosphatase family protein [Streptomyces sp. NBC_00234]
MIAALDDLTVDLVPHARSVAREGWTGRELARPLSSRGLRQADSLAVVMRDSIDAIYCSPAKRCVQTVEPLARCLGLSIATAPGLATPDGTYQPREWTEGFFSPFERELGGAWMAGAALAVLIEMGHAHPGGHVVACSHGDVIPVLVAQALALYGHASPPPVVDRGGWYRMRFGTHALTVEPRGPVVPLPSTAIPTS